MRIFISDIEAGMLAIDTTVLRNSALLESS